MDSEKTWNTIAKSFDQTRRIPWKECLDFIEKLANESIVADIGCGNGRHLIPCAKHCKKVIGVDLSKQLLDIVKEKLASEKIKNVRLIHADATKIPIEDRSVDAVPSPCLAFAGPPGGRGHRGGEAAGPPRRLRGDAGRPALRRRTGPS